MADKQNWSSFRKRILIQKPVPVVYASWVTQQHLESWFLERAIFFETDEKQRLPAEPFQKSDKFLWKWHNWDFNEEGEVLDAIENERIAFTFGAGGKVIVEFNPVGDHTELILTQTEIPTDEKSKHELYVGCATGWTFWMANLKAWLEHRVTLHATGLSQEETTDLVNS